MRLDRAGARGLVADLTVAGCLTRQAAFSVAAAMLERGEAAIDALIAPFDLAQTGAEAVGVILRRQRAREVIAAIYGIRPAAVPGGFLRALLRVQEVRSVTSGLDPFAEPVAYARLFEIFVQRKHSPAAHALRYAGPLHALHLRAVAELDPLLVLPEVLRVLHGPDTIRAANRLVALLRACVSTADDDSLRLALRQSLGGTEPLRKFAERVLQRADRLPVPDLPPLEGLRFFASTAEIETFAAEMKNCAASYITEIALGLKLVCSYTHIDEAGVAVPLAVLLAPMADGGWEIDQIAAKANVRPPKPVLRAALQRLMGIGLRVAGPAPGGSYDRDLANLLGQHCYFRLGDALPDIIEDTETASDDGVSGIEPSEGVQAMLQRVTGAT
ncbi:hypothetical protein [Methylobacterium sp. CM6257]